MMRLKRHRELATIPPMHLTAKGSNVVLMKSPKESARRSPWAMWAVLFLIVAVAATYLAELYLFVPGYLYRVEKSELLVSRARSALQALDEARARGEETYPLYVPARIIEPDGFLRETLPMIAIGDRTVFPLGGIAGARTLFCNEHGQWLDYVSDRNGFHNPDGIWDLGRAQVVVVGDSYAHGACVPSERGLAAVVRRKFPRTVNLAMGNNGPLLELAALSEYGSHLRPRVVIWAFYGGNDFTDLDKEKGHPLLMRYLEDPAFSQNLFEDRGGLDDSMKLVLGALNEKAARKVSMPQSVLKLKDVVDILLIRYIRSKLGLAFGGTSRSDSKRRKDIRLFERIMRAAKQRTESWGGKMVFLYLFGYSDYCGYHQHTSDVCDARARVTVGSAPRGVVPDTDVIDVIERLGIERIRLEDHLFSTMQPLELYYYPGSHYTAEAYEKIGNLVVEAISTPVSGATD